MNKIPLNAIKIWDAIFPDKMQQSVVLTNVNCRLCSSDVSITEEAEIP